MRSRRKPSSSGIRLLNLTQVEEEDIIKLLRRTIKKEYPNAKVYKGALETLAELSVGDARTALGSLETAIAISKSKPIDEKIILSAMQQATALFQQGKLAMAMQWYYFHGSNSDPASNPLADSTGFANLPGAVGRDGMFRRQFSVGGQGMGINTYSGKIETLTAFMEWYFQPEQQERYAAVCQTGLQSVLESDAWQGLNSYNSLFATALDYTNDYWHLPEYSILLDILQEEVSNAISGSKSVQQALDDAAERHEETLERAGYEISRSDETPAVPDTMISPVGSAEVVVLPTN